MHYGIALWSGKPDDALQLPGSLGVCSEVQLLSALLCSVSAVK